MAWLSQEAEKEENRLALAYKQNLILELNKFHRQINPENFLTKIIHEYEQQKEIVNNNLKQQLLYVPGEDPQLIKENFLKDLNHWLWNNYKIRISFGVAANCNYRKFQYLINSDHFKKIEPDRLKTFSRALVLKGFDKLYYWNGPRVGQKINLKKSFNNEIADNRKKILDKLRPEIMGNFWNNDFYEGNFFRVYSNNLGGQKLYQYRRVKTAINKEKKSVLGSYVLFILSSDVSYQYILKKAVEQQSTVAGLNKQIFFGEKDNVVNGFEDVVYLESLLPGEYTSVINSPDITEKNRNAKILFSIKRPKNDNPYKFYKKIAFSTGFLLLLMFLFFSKSNHEREKRFPLKIRWKLSAIIGLCILLPLGGVSIALSGMVIDEQNEFEGKIKSKLKGQVDEFAHALSERVLNRLLVNLSLKKNMVNIFNHSENEQLKVAKSLIRKGDSIDELILFSDSGEQIFTKGKSEEVDSRLFQSVAWYLFYNWNGKLKGGKKLSPLVMDIVDSFWNPFGISKKLNDEGLDTGILNDINVFKRMHVLFYSTVASSSHGSNLGLICFIKLHSVLPFIDFYRNYVAKNISKFNYWYENCQFTYTIVPVRSLGRDRRGWPQTNARSMNLSPEIAEFSKYINEDLQIFSMPAGKSIFFWKHVPIANVIVAGKVFIPEASQKNGFVYFVIFLLLLFGVVLSVLMGDFLSYVFLEPVKILEKATKKVSAGHLKTVVELGESKEFLLVAMAFNKMTGALRQRERLKTFVPKRLSEEITGKRQRMATLNGERVEAVILSSDIRSFTTLTEKTSPEELVEGLNSYFEVMQQEIERQNGMVIKLIGDAILAAFFPEPQLEPAYKRALASARGMVSELKKWNIKRITQDCFILENGIGLAMGEVLACKLGTEGGRHEFTIIGNSIKLANDLEALTAKTSETSIMVSDNIAKKLDENEMLGPAEGNLSAWKIKE